MPEDVRLVKCDCDMSCLFQSFRAAKLRLLNFLSLFRDLQKPTRFGGGGGSSRIFPGSPQVSTRFGGGGGSSSNFP